MKLRSKAGFTLVELIVVIAILAILAGVAIPVYSGYIKKANETADLQLLDSVKTAVDAAYATADAKPDQIQVVDGTPDSVNVKFGNGNFGAMAATALDEFELYFTGTDNGPISITLKSGNTATWDGTKWTITTAS